MGSLQKSKLAASSKAVDPTLAALFETSAKPVAPLKSRYTEEAPPKTQKKRQDEDVEDEDEEEEEGVDPDADLSELDSDEMEDFDNSDEEEDDDEDSEADDSEDQASSEEEEIAPAKVAEAVTSGETNTKERKRKRKQQEENYDLEAKYFKALAEEEEKVPKRQKNEKKKDAEEDEDTPMADADDDDAVSVDDEDMVGSEEDEPPVHESLAKNPAETEFEKASRTIFVSNVSTEAITSRSAKRKLLNHLSSVLDSKASPPQKITSIRFRSTAFAAAGIPKRAAYIKREVMNATTRSTNAYVVYSTPVAVRKAVQELNGTVVLDRHIRVDSVAHPSPVDHRRCVFVGNLGFVDDEVVLTTKVDEEGNEVTEKKKRGKVPMDVEEGLWKVFGEKAGKVESVRVVRDPHTRVGKGFAYVQFYDGNSVESALLLNEKKFPPLLPRILRVSRCKAPHKTARAIEAKQAKFNFNAKQAARQPKGEYIAKPTPENQTLSGRAAKLLGKTAAQKAAAEARMKEKKARRQERPSREEKEARRAAKGEEDVTKGFKSPEDIVFEGRRASSKDGKPKDLKFKGQGGKKKDPRKGGRRSAKDSRGGQRAAKWKASGGKKE
ncbi:Nucleolar protein 12 [Coniochaeta pulveracea]|uniref:Nucleolar protein 12 n=1 Tax=Coniochaeta pulveracea TaxID=177199 RepID=A0A420Y7D4_9PEZI|nr:Nucleolar protein 12 [Coniochaeta pulveracea]